MWQASDVEKIFVIGGQRLYEEAMHHPACRYAYVTYIDADYECDAYFPYLQLYSGDWELACTGPILKTIDGTRYVYLKYQRLAR